MDIKKATLTVREFLEPSRSAHLPRRSW